MRKESDAEGMRYLQELKEAVDVGYAEAKTDREYWWVVCGGMNGRAGVPSNVVLESASTSIRKDDVQMAVKVRNWSPWPSGGLTVVAWYCPEPYNGGQIEGFAVSKMDVSRGVCSGRTASTFETVKFAGTPPEGTYHEVIILYEAMSDGMWVAVSWLNMPNAVVYRPQTGFFGRLARDAAKGALGQDKFLDPYTTRLQAKRGTASSKVSLSGVSWRADANWSRINVEFGRIEISSDTPQTGSLKVVFWLANEPFDPAANKINAVCQLGEAPFQGDPYQLGFENGFAVEGAASQIVRSADAPAGDYWIIITVNEYHESGRWYIVGYANFQNMCHYEPRP